MVLIASPSPRTSRGEGRGGKHQPRRKLPPLTLTLSPQAGRGDRSKSAARARFYSGRAWHDAPVYLREVLTPGVRLAGPALVIEPHQTVVVEPGWSLEVSARDDLVLRRTTPRKREVLGKTADPVLLEVFNNLYMSIAEQMGEALSNTAQSVNIKERLDFSCAVFDAKGELVANAPHMPIHLGSMDRSVETVIRLNEGKLKPGDVHMLNAPYNGGTHLPDITVITPVFDEAGSGDPLLCGQPRPPGGHRRPGARLHDAARHHHRGGRRLHRRLQAGRPGPLPGGGDARAADGRQVSRAHAGQEHRRPQGARGGQRQGRRGAAQDGGAVRSRRGQGLHAARAGQCRGERAAAAVEAGRRRLPGGDGPGQLGRREDHGRSRESPRARRLLGHVAGAGQQLQCAGARDARGHALRVPRDGERADPDERRLPQADRHRHPRALDAEAGLSGRRGGGQRGDQPDRHQLPVRRPEGHGAEPGHHEQPHLRQRQVPVLRDHLLGQSGRSRLRRHRPACTCT